MLTGLISRLRGQVWVRVECPFPERVLNLCGERNLAFWDLEWESETAFTCRLSRQDFAALRRAVEPLDCSLRVVRREGAPYFLSRFRHRQALVVGLVGCGLALFLGTFFVWDFQVEGNETVPTEEILRALERNGVGLGSFGLSLDGEDLRNHILLEIPELSWIAVNVSGCRAHVQVRERVEKPELWDETTPSNVVARRTGLVLRVRAMNGVAAVLPGTAVTEGQLLISGVEDLETLGARMLAGTGSVEGRTWYTLTTRIPLTVQEKRYTGEEKRFLSLTVGKQRVKFFSNSSVEGEKYDKMAHNDRGIFLGIPLPIKLTVETCCFYETESVERSAAEAERLGENILKQQLETMIEPYGAVSSTLCTSRQKGDVLEVTLSAECVEELGIRVPIYTEVPDESP